LDYIELNTDVLVLDNPVSKADILARFTEESDGAVGSSSRRAAHILLEADDDGVVDEILVSLTAGESFADLAERYSTDAGSAGIGGDLGFSDGSLFPESFESALAALEVGTVSGPVVTDSGIHLIKLLEIDETTFELESESARIALQLQRERADAILLEKLAQLRELSYNAESLAEIAQDTGLVASVSEPFSRRGGAGIGAIPEVIESAFSDEVLLDKYASEVLVLEDDRYVVVKLREHIVAYQKPLEEVEADVASAYAALHGAELLAQQGAELMARVDAGTSVEDVAKANDLDWQVALEARRSSSAVNAEVNQFAFRLVGAKTPANDSFINRNGDFVIVSLQRSVAGDYDSMSSTDQRALKDAVLQAAANREISAFQQALVENAAVVR
jgi:peptidyl-prolyl cis-trans isomerase D